MLIGIGLLAFWGGVEDDGRTIGSLVFKKVAFLIYVVATFLI